MDIRLTPDTVDVLRAHFEDATMCDPSMAPIELFNLWVNAIITQTGEECNLWEDYGDDDSLERVRQEQLT